MAYSRAVINTQLIPFYQDLFVYTGKSFINQAARLCLTEKRKAILHEKCFDGGVVIDLLQAFNAISHKLL